MKKFIYLLSLITPFFLGNFAYAALPTDLADLVEDSAPAVVNITSKKEVTRNFSRSPLDEFERFFGIPRGQYPQQPEPETREAIGFGSGFIFKNEYILTNFHVVDGATEVIVSLNDRREFQAEIVGVDPLSDLAVLKIDGNNLKKVKIGDSDKLSVGDWVIAIGSPFSFDFSVTAGIISAKGRSINNNNIGNYVPFIQTDVAINPGNSGGPLLNLDGEVVGINSQIYSRSGGYQGLAFAIPINVAMEVADQIVKNGKVARGYLGVRVGEVDNDLALALGMKKPYGALINDVEKGESADDGGLLPGDVILEFDEKEIKFSGDLPHVVGRIMPGTKADAKVFREGKEITLTFDLGELPSDDRSFVPARNSATEDPLGMRIADATEENTGREGIEGVVVTRVASGSPASGRIARGDVITEIRASGKKYQIQSVEDFENAVKDFESGDRIALVGRRGTNRFFVAITVE